MRKLLLTLLLAVLLASSAFAQIPPGGGGSSTPAVGDITGLGTGVGTFLATPSSANLAAALTDESGTGVVCMTISCQMTTPNIGAATGTSLNISGASIAANYTAAAGGWLGWVGRAFMYSSGDGIIRFLNNAETDFDRLQLGGVTSSFPSIKRATTRAQCRLADDSAACAFEGKHNSSDGTAGATTTCTIVGLTSITVKDGLVTSCS